MLSERFTITFSKKTWDDLPLLIQDMINKELHPVSSNLESKLCFCLKNLDNKISNLSNPVAINQNFSSFDQSTTFKSNDRLFGTIGTLILTGGSITVLTTTTVFGGVLLATGALLTAIPSYHWYKRNQRVKEECLSKGIEEIRRSINTIRTLNIPELKKLGQIHAEQKRKHTLSQIETLDKNIEEIIKSRNEKLATFPDLDLIKKDNDTLLELITIGESEVIQ